jgi:uncharacterized protein involved in exopolysaccharide biosynthesis
MSGLAATAIAVTVSCLTPPLYKSEARFEFGTDAPDSALALLRSPAVLSEIGVQPSRLTIRPVVGTGKVEISVLDEDPHRAADLANGVATVYREARAKLDAAGRPDRISAVESAMSEASAAFEAIKHESDAVTQSLAKAKADYGENPDGPWRRKAELDGAEEESAKLQRQLDDLRKAPFPEFLHVANRYKLINSDRMTWVAEYLGTNTTLQAQTQAGLPANHPDVVRARQRLAELRVQLEKDGADLTASLALKIEALQQRASSLSKERDAARIELGKALAANDLVSRNLESAQAKLRAAQIQVAAVQAQESAEPDYIVVVQEATVARHPTQPGFWVPLLLSPFVGLLGGLLIRALRLSRPRTGRPRAAIA